MAPFSDKLNVYLTMELKLKVPCHTRPLWLVLEQENCANNNIREFNDSLKWFFMTFQSILWNWMFPAVESHPTLGRKSIFLMDQLRAHAEVEFFFKNTIFLINYNMYRLGCKRLIHLLLLWDCLISSEILVAWDDNCKGMTAFLDWLF